MQDYLKGLDEHIESGVEPVDTAMIDPAPLLKPTLEEATKVDPDQFSKSLQLSRDTGLPTQVVQIAQPELERQQRMSKFDFDHISKDTPLTAEFLSMYDHAAVAHDDTENLSNLERFIKDTRQYTSDVAEQFTQGRRIVEASEIGTTRMWSHLGIGDAATEDQLNRLKDLENEMTDSNPLAEYGFVPGIPMAAAEQLPIMWDILITGLGYGAASAPVGAGVGGAIAGPKGAIAGAVTAFKWGSRGGIAKAAFDLEGGMAFNEYSAMQDDMGNLVDPEVAAAAAFTVGALNAGLELASLMALGRTVTPAMRMIIRDRVKWMMKREAGQTTLKHIAGTYGTAVGMQVTTEILQEFMSIVGGELVKYADESSFDEQDFAQAVDNVFSEDTFDELTEAGTKALQAGIALAAPGTAVSTAMYARNQRQLAENEQMRIDDLNSITGDSKLKTRDPDSFREFMQSVDPDSDVYIDGAQAILYLQSKSTDQKESDPALKLLQAQVDEARATGGDMVIKLADFATDITGTEHFDALRPHMTLSAETVSPFRQEQSQVETQRYVKDLMTQAQDNVSQYVEAQEIFTTVRDQLIESGRYNSQQASVMSQIVPAWATVQAQYRGVSVEQVYRESGLMIEGPMTGRPEPVTSFEQQGFDTDRKWFHGTSMDFDQVDMSKTQQHDEGFLGAGFYVTSDAGLAGDYAKKSARRVPGEEKVKQFYIKPGNYKQYTLAEKPDIANRIRSGEITAQQFAEELQTQGFDGAEVVDGQGNVVERVVYNPDNIVGVEDARVQEPEQGDEGRGTGRRALSPLQDAPSVEGFHGPDPQLVAVAEQYARENGIDLKRQSEYVDVDPERATRIAQAYEAMEHNPQDPAVAEAFENLIQQTLAQYRALEKAGYKFWFMDMNNPDNVEYASSPWNAMRDIRTNKEMGVFPTDEGFGTQEAFDPSTNPLLADTGIEWPVGSPDGEVTKPVMANDLFRAVHDAFGHGLEGSGFRARGEENAWQAHVRLFTGSAVGAITTETRGQNSWLNYGPYGEQNRTAKTEDTVFADQKTGLMPEWTWTEGRAGDMVDQGVQDGRTTSRFEQSPVQARGFIRANNVKPSVSYGRAKSGSTSVVGIHYSRERRGFLDAGKYGTGIKGAEARRVVGDPLLSKRIHFYVDGGAGLAPEVGVGEQVHAVQLNNVYDIKADPDGILTAVKADGIQGKEIINEIERRVVAAGYDGLYQPRAMHVPNMPDNVMGVVTLIGDHAVRVEHLGDINTVSDQYGPMILRQSPTHQAQRNSIGLYSAVEKAALEMNIPQWKPKKSEDRSADVKQLSDQRSDLIRQRNDINELEKSEKSKVYADFDQAGDTSYGAIEQRQVQRRAIEDKYDLMVEPIHQQIEAVNQQLAQIRRQTVPVAKGKDVWAKLRTMQGVKKEELEWLGVEEWLSQRDDVSRDELVKYIRENGINLYEIVADQSVIRDEYEMQWTQEVLDDRAEYEYRIEDLMDDFDNGDYVDILYDDTMEELVAQEEPSIREALELDDSVEVDPYDDDVRSYVVDEFSYTFRERYEEKVEEYAREEYMDNPVIEYTHAESGMEIVGNDDTVYIIISPDRGQLPDTVYDFQEASDIARDYAFDNELIDGAGDAETTTKWEEYVAEGDYDNYRELKLTLPDTSDEFVYSAHFEDPNVLAFLRVDDRKLAITDEAVIPDFESVNIPRPAELGREVFEADEFPGTYYNTQSDEFWSDILKTKTPEQIERARSMWRNWSVAERIENYNLGSDQYYARQKQKRLDAVRQSKADMKKNTYFIDEFQSDWHQQGRQKGYKTGENTRNLEQQLNELEAQSDALFSNIDPEILLEFNMITGGGRGSFYRVTTVIKELFTGEAKDQYDKDLIDQMWQVINNSPDLLVYATKVKEVVDAESKITTERTGVPDAPFKGDAWIGLGMKRALVDAVERGYDAVAWVDSNVLTDRWSEQYRTLYETQYDVKMKSIVKKLTGKDPEHFDFEGVRHTEGQLGYWIIPITDQLRDQITQGSYPLFQRQEDARGYYDPSNSLIRLTESSDLSTFLHEFAHFMYDMETKNPDSKFIKPIKDWFKSNAQDISKEATGYAEQKDVSVEDVYRYVDRGTTGDTTIDLAVERTVHEQFARGFESYLMEGKAPSLELRNVFRTIARWLTQIYRAVRGQMNVNLDDQMRQVFDRLIATEEQIENAQARAQFEPLFTDAAMAGMTEKEFEKYQERHQKGKDLANETLRDKLIKQLRRQTKQWWKLEKSILVENQVEELEREKVYAAIKVLRGDKLKLDLAAVKQMVGEEKTDKLGRTSIRVPDQLRGMTRGGAEGVHPDEAAGFLGYPSGAELLHDIVNAPKITDRAEANAEQQMVDRHGDLLNDGSIEREADIAIQNEERGKLILQELKVLVRGTNRPMIERQTLESLAEDNIGKLSFREINPAKYRRAEIRAAQESAAAFATGDRSGAAAAKARQALNFYLGKAAQKAKDDTLKVVDFMGRYRQKKIREAIQSAGNQYWEQLDKILARFEFRKSASLRAVDQTNQSLNEWSRERVEQDGDGLVLSPEVLNESYVTHWKNVPYTELKGITDSVKNIEHVARYSNKVVTAEQEMRFQEFVQNWVDHMNRVQPDRFKSQRTTVAEGRNWGRWAMGQMTKIPYLASWLDGGERVGLSHDTLVQPFVDAYDKELSMWNEIGKPVLSMINDRPKADRARMMKKIFIPEIQNELNDGNLFGHQVIAVALNTGNAGNLKKMLLGEGWANQDDPSSISIENRQLQAVLVHMTESDWKMVQTIWDQMDKLYPQLAEVHRRTTGLVPPKIEATPVETPFGTFNGGYYPMKYDEHRSYRAELTEDKLRAETESMFGGSGIQANVNASATNERTGYYAPVRLSLDVVPNHFQETIHYITHHDAVRQTNKLIRHPEVAKTIKAKLGPEEFAQLKPWLNDIAKDGRESQTRLFWDSIFSRLRFGTTLTIMGFSASTGLMQLLGLTNTMGEIGAKYTFRSIRSILGSPSDMASAWEFATENSKVMKHRMETMDREIRNAMKHIEGKQGMLAGFQEVSMKHIAILQTYVVDLPTWHAGYLKGLDQHGDEARAIKYADWAVENIQGSGLKHNMAAIMRSRGKFDQILTMFMTFFSALWNMERDLVKGARAKTYSYSSIAAKLMFFFTLPVFLEMVLKGEFAGDEGEKEPEEQLERYLTLMALYPTTSVPVARDIANGVLSGYGYNISPIAQLMGAGVESVPELMTRPFTDEEITRGQIKSVTRLTGAALGVPGVYQFWRTGEHLEEVLVEGEELTLKELLYGPEKK